VGLGIGVGVGVGDAISVGLDVGLGIGVGVAVGWAVGVAVAVGVGVGVLAVGMMNVASATFWPLCEPLSILAAIKWLPGVAVNGTVTAALKVPLARTLNVGIPPALPSNSS